MAHIEPLAGTFLACLTSGQDKTRTSQYMIQGLCLECFWYFKTRIKTVFQVPVLILSLVTTLPIHNYLHGIVQMADLAFLSRVGYSGAVVGSPLQRSHLKDVRNAAVVPFVEKPGEGRRCCLCLDTDVWED